MQTKYFHCQFRQVFASTIITIDVVATADVPIADDIDSTVIAITDIISSGIAATSVTTTSVATASVTVVNSSNRYCDCSSCTAVLFATSNDTRNNI
ncbi:hypothetical protein P7E26_07050 [Enterococcus gallinarum]|nr:hypothetical protein [Enterococcus gallinarum]